MPCPSRQSLTPSALGFSWSSTHGHLLAGVRSVSVFLRFGWPSRIAVVCGLKKAAQAWVRETMAIAHTDYRSHMGITRG